jgi:hypothetical protein
LSDFSKFYASAEFLQAGKDIYATVPLEHFGPPGEVFPPEVKSLHPNLNTPFFVLLTAPLARIPYRDAFHVFSLLSLVLGALGVALVERATAGQRSPARLLLFLFLFLAYFPSLVSIAYGQVSFLLFFLVVVCWLALRTGRDVTAGIMCGLLVSTKISTGMFVVYFIALRKWRLLGWSVAAFALCNAVVVYRLGWEVYGRYLSVIDSTTWYGASWNASFLGFFSRIFGGSENVPLMDLPQLAFGLSLALSLLAIGVLVWLTAAKVPVPERFPDVTYCLTIVVMIMVSPYGWIYYFPLLFLPLVVSWKEAGRLDAPFCRMVIALAWAMSTLPHALVPAHLNNTALPWFTRQGAFFYALVLFAGALVWIAVSTKAEEAISGAKFNKRREAAG